MLDQELAVLLSALHTTGDAIVKQREVGFKTSLKSNHSPLTEIDLLANAMLKNMLVGSFPTYGWLSEETLDDEKRLSSARTWIIDPIDGTKEFIQGLPEYAISVALVENKEAILAGIYNPATQELFYATKNHGAYLNGKCIFCNDSLKQPFHFLASRSEEKKGLWDVYKKSHQVTLCGSIAYKLALVAAGRAHATFSLTPKNEWDIAAGALLIQEAGGIICDQFKNNFTFNNPKTLVSGLIASGAQVFDTVYKTIKGASV